MEGDKSAVVSRVEDEVSAFFPSFLWVLRDFSLQLADEDGSPLSARDYLEQCLQQQEGFSSDAQARNRTRRVLTSFFKDRDCATLVRPVEDEAQLQMIDSLPEAALRVEFRAQLAELKLRIAEEVCLRSLPIGYCVMNACTPTQYYPHPRCSWSDQRLCKGSL